jgi:hypothetical protein
MKSRWGICLVLAAAAFMPVPVSAQALLPPYEITTSIRSMGLEPVSPPVRRGQRYEIIAVDRRGVGVRVAADGFSGRVLFVEELNGPVRAGRADPPGYPGDDAPPRQGYPRQGASEPGEPSVVYATPRETNPPRPPARVPSAAKPPVPKVAAKPPAKPAAPAEATASTETRSAAEEKPADTTGSTTAAAPPPPPPEKNPALAAPPVQAFD